MNIEEVDRIFGWAREQIGRTDLSSDQYERVNEILDGMRKPFVEKLNRRPVGWIVVDHDTDRDVSVVYGTEGSAEEALARFNNDAGRPRYGLRPVR